MSFIEGIKNRAKEDKKTIILPEAEDKRVLEAASKVIKQGFAKVILLGDEEKIKEDSSKNKTKSTRKQCKYRGSNNNKSTNIRKL